MVRIKNRWVLFELIQDPVIENGEVTFPLHPINVTEDDLRQAIWSALAIDYGDFGLGITRSVLVKWYNPVTHIGICRVPREYTDLALATMFFMKKIKQYQCSFRILRISGTIIGVQKEAINRDREIYLENAAKQGTDMTNVGDLLAKTAADINKLKAFG